MASDGTRQSGVASDGLGPLISSHPPIKEALREQTRVPRVVGLVGRAGLVLAAVVALRSGEVSYLYSIGGLAVLLMGAGWLVGRQATRTSFLHVELYREGLRIETTYDSEELRWDAVRKVGIKTSVHRSGWGEYAFTFARDDAPELEVNVPTTGIADPAAILAAVVREVALCLTPGAERELNASRTVEFGPLVLHRDWLSNNGDRHDWSEIDELRLSNGRLSAQANGESWFSHRVDEVPNLPVFVALSVDRMPQRPSPDDWVRTYGD